MVYWPDRPEKVVPCALFGVFGCLHKHGVVLFSIFRNNAKIRVSFSSYIRVLLP